MTNVPDKQHSNLTLTTSDGIKLRGIRIKPEQSDCSLIVVHGVGEHFNRYLEFAKKISSSDCTCYLYDQRGHGQSDGKRGHISKFEDYTNDLKLIYDLVSSESQNHPVFVYGHSMGSIVATVFTLNLQEKIKGLILTGFPFKPYVPISGLTLKLIKLIGKAIPQVSIPTMINVKQLSHDEVMWKTYEQDQMINKTVTLNWAAEFYSTLDWLKQNLFKLELPLLMMHGSEDEIARLNGAEQAVKIIRSKEKTFRVFKGQRHELLNELSPTPDQVTEQMQDWMRQRLSG